MAGFMAGFASGFNTSFNRARERQAQQEDDMFKLRYMDAIKRRDEREADKKQDKKDVEYAKSMARAYGQPEAAWQEVYKMKKSGADETTIVKVLSENKFNSNWKSSDVPSDKEEKEPGLVEMAGASVNAQMSASGLAPPEDGGIFKGGNQNQQNRVNDRVGETMGIPGDQVGLDTGTADPSRFPERPAPPPTAGSIPDPSQEQTQNTGVEPVERAPLPDTQAETEAPAPKMSEESGTPSTTDGPWIPKVKEDDYYKANSVAEAQVNLVKAQRNGNPASIQLAQDVLDANIAAEALKAKMDAKAKGLLETPQLAAVQTGPDPTKDWDYLRPGKEEGTWVNPKDPSKIYRNGDVRVFEKSMTDAMNDQSKAIREPATKYRQSVTGFVANVRNADELMANINANPGVAGWAGVISKTGDEIVRNVGGVIAMAQQDVAEDGIMSSTNQKQLDDSISALKQQLNSFVGPETQNSIERMAIARRLYEAQAVKMAYAQAASVGQTGAGVAAKEFERFYKEFLNPNEDAIKKGITTYIIQSYDVLKQEGAALNQFNPDIDAFYQTYGVPSPLKAAPDLDEMINLSPDTASAFERVRTMHAQMDENQANPDQIRTSPEGMRAIGKTPDGKIVYEDKNGQRWVQ